MSNIQIYKKPMLAVLEENTKIRDYAIEKKILYSTKIVNDLLLDLGVGVKVEEEQHKRLIQYISEECGRFTFEEIQQAFKMVLNGSLEMDLFQQINVLVFSKVMKLYQKHKNEKLRTYRLNKPKRDLMNEKEKKDLMIQGVTKQLEYFLNYRKVDQSRIYVYDVFDKLGLMPSDIDYKNSVKKDAIEILKKEYSEKKAKNKDHHKEIKIAIQQINNEKSFLIIQKCKELALEDYLRKELKEKIDIQRLINLFYIE